VTQCILSSLMSEMFVELLPSTSVVGEVSSTVISSIPGGVLTLIVALLGVVGVTLIVKSLADLSDPDEYGGFTSHLYVASCFVVCLEPLYITFEVLEYTSMTAFIVTTAVGSMTFLALFIVAENAYVKGLRSQAAQRRAEVDAVVIETK